MSIATTLRGMVWIYTIAAMRMDQLLLMNAVGTEIRTLIMLKPRRIADISQVSYYDRVPQVPLFLRNDSICDFVLG